MGRIELENFQLLEAWPIRALRKFYSDINGLGACLLPNIGGEEIPYLESVIMRGA